MRRDCALRATLVDVAYRTWGCVALDCTLCASMACFGEICPSGLVVVVVMWEVAELGLGRHLVLRWGRGVFVCFFAVISVFLVLVFAVSVSCRFLGAGRLARGGGAPPPT